MGFSPIGEALTVTTNREFPLKPRVNSAVMLFTNNRCCLIGPEAAPVEA